MKTIIKVIFLISLISSCKSKTEDLDQKTDHQKLIITYNGEGDIVQFKMFEGLHLILTKDSTAGSFMGILEIPNLDEAIFSYDIVIHKKDSTGRMLELEPQINSFQLNQTLAIVKQEQFLWIGGKRKADYLENEGLKGSLTTRSMPSEFLDVAREITIYTPKEVTSEIPHIYFTDGSMVEYYAPYADRLISTNVIEPVRLVGIHNSSSNRYEEYVQGSNENEIFRKHESFVYNEVLDAIESDIDNWKGKRFIYGVSNGAAFCMHAGLNHPNVFEEIIAFSTADYISSMAQMMNPINFKFKEYPKFYMGAGRYETSIFQGNVQFLVLMNDNDIQVEFKEFIAGHDYNVWRIEFLDYLESRFQRSIIKNQGIK